MNNRTQLIIEWTATIIAITGAILNAFLFKQGFYLWLTSNSLFLYFNFKHKHWGLALVFATYLVITVIGIIYWR